MLCPLPSRSFLIHCTLVILQFNFRYPEMLIGRAVIQAVSSPLPTTVARVRCQVKSSGICGTGSGTGESVLRALRFPLQILIPPRVLHARLPSGAGTSGPLVASVSSGLSVTPTHAINNRRRHWHC
jgi:hypothetical protein